MSEKKAGEVRETAVQPFEAVDRTPPRTQAWDALKRALKADVDEALFEHMAGDESTAFEAGANRTVAVNVIDDRGNELMVVRELPG